MRTSLAFVLLGIPTGKSANSTNRRLNASPCRRATYRVSIEKFPSSITAVMAIEWEGSVDVLRKDLLAGHLRPRTQPTAFSHSCHYQCYWLSNMKFRLITAAVMPIAWKDSRHNIVRPSGGSPRPPAAQIPFLYHLINPNAPWDLPEGLSCHH